MGLCSGDTEALMGLLETDALPGRRFYATTLDAGGTLRWYPVIADMAQSADLAFTSGPFVHSGDDGAKIHGDFLSLWKRDSDCRWQIEFEGSISHAAPTQTEPGLKSDQAHYTRRDGPPAALVTADAVSQSMSDFKDTLKEDGFAAGLRTYGRTLDFYFLIDGEAPMGMAAANRYLTAHMMAGEWRERARGLSADSTFAYSVGEIHGAHQRSSHICVQIWQYDPRVVNWGLRLLFISPSMSK